MVAIHNIGPKKPNQPRWINAELNKEINNLSPRVVSKLKIPRLGLPPGSFFSQISITVIHKAIKILAKANNGEDNPEVSVPPLKVTKVELL